MSVPLAYLGIIVIWTTTPLAIKWSGEEVGFLFAVTARMAIAFVICFAIVLVWKKRLPMNWRSLHVYVAMAFPLFIGMTSTYWGAQYLPSGVISVLFGLVPFFTGILASIWLKEKSFNTPRVIGLLLGMLGLTIVFYKSVLISESMLFGIFGVLLGAAMHALSTVWMKRVAKEFSAISANTGGLIIVIFLFSITWLLSNESLPEVIPDYVGASILYLGVAGSVFGALLFFYTLKHVDANTIGLLPLITPITALLLGHYLNDEVVEIETVVGTATIICGLIVYQWSSFFVLSYEKVRKAKKEIR